MCDGWCGDESGVVMGAVDGVVVGGVVMSGVVMGVVDGVVMGWW